MKGKIFTPTLIMLGLMSVYGSAEAGAVNDDFQQAFINDSKLSLNSALYVRQRAVKDLKTGSYSADGSQGGIENQTANISIDYKGGYYKDVIGLDFMAASNIKLGQSVGQSEILLYDYDCKGDGTLNPCEKSYAAIPIAALKAKYGNDNFLFNITGGYTTINSGTIKNSWGLNPHSYRGIDTSLALSKVKLTYAWADQFRNDWTDSFHDMTNTWHQNEAANLSGVKPGAIINHIQSAGLVYDADG
ncbi:TPA: porin, partial [Aeromonas sobria]|nr:porin [Aeromonas sobria]